MGEYCLFFFGWKCLLVCFFLKDASFFKFTIDKKLTQTSAFEEILEITSSFEKPNIYCMPVGESRSNIWHNDKAVFEFCMKHGFNYSDRLHIRVFDTTQGV
jgi:organic radical activating enzyme